MSVLLLKLVAWCLLAISLAIGGFSLLSALGSTEHVPALLANSACYLILGPLIWAGLLVTAKKIEARQEANIPNSQRKP